MALPQLLRMVQELKGTLVTVMGKLVPSGVILMWSGSTDTIPAGWALCNGQDGTPDLTDRFILGAGKTYQPGTTGGAATVSPPASPPEALMQGLPFKTQPFPSGPEPQVPESAFKARRWMEIPCRAMHIPLSSHLSIETTGGVIAAI